MSKKSLATRVDWTLAALCGFFATMGLMFGKSNFILFSIFVVLVIILDILIRRFNE